MSYVIHVNNTNKDGVPSIFLFHIVLKTHMLYVLNILQVDCFMHLAYDLALLMLLNLGLSLYTHVGFVKPHH